MKNIFLNMIAIATMIGSSLCVGYAYSNVKCERQVDKLESELSKAKLKNIDLTYLANRNMIVKDSLQAVLNAEHQELITVKHQPTKTVYLRPKVDTADVIAPYLSDLQFMNEVNNDLRFKLNVALYQRDSVFVALNKRLGN